MKNMPKMKSKAIMMVVVTGVYGEVKEPLTQKTVSILKTKEIKKY
jgi:hypothetical protein